MFLYSTVSTLNPEDETFIRNIRLKYYIKILPIVGIVVTISPNFNLYKIVVLPAASNPTISIRISFFPNNPLNKFANIFPIFNFFYELDSFCFFKSIYVSKLEK